MSSGRNHEEGHTSDGSGSGQGTASSSSSRASLNTDGDVVMDVVQQDPPLPQHQIPIPVSSGPDDPFATSVVSQSPLELQHAGTSSQDIPEAPQADSVTNAAPDPFVLPIPPPELDELRSIFPRSRLLARRHQRRLRSEGGHAQSNGNPRDLGIARPSSAAGLGGDPLSSPSPLSLGGRGRVPNRRASYPPRPIANFIGTGNQTTQLPGPHAAASGQFGFNVEGPSSGLSQDPSTPGAATAMSLDGSPTPRATVIHHLPNGDDDDFDTPIVRPRRRVSSFGGDPFASLVPHGRPQNPSAPESSSSASTGPSTSSDPFMGYDNGENNETSQSASSHPRRMILSDNYDIFDQGLMERVGRELLNSRYRLTPGMIATTHQLAMADDHFYERRWHGLLMINETSVLEYHNPAQSRPDVRDDQRTDRRLVFVYAQTIDTSMRWFLVVNGRGLVPAPQMQGPPENALNLFQYFFMRAGGPANINRYATLVAPGLVDRSNAALNSNILLLGMNPEANQQTAALRVATPAETAAAQPGLLSRFGNPPNSAGSTNAPDLVNQEMGFISEPGPAGTYILRYGPMPIQNAPEDPSAGAAMPSNDAMVLDTAGPHENGLGSSTGPNGVSGASSTASSSQHRIPGLNYHHGFGLPPAQGSFLAGSVMPQPNPSMPPAPSLAPVLPNIPILDSIDLNTPASNAGAFSQPLVLQDGLPSPVDHFADWNPGFIPGIGGSHGNASSIPGLGLTTAGHMTGTTVGATTAPQTNGVPDVPGRNPMNPFFFEGEHTTIDRTAGGSDELGHIPLFPPTPAPNNNHNNAVGDEGYGGQEGAGEPGSDEDAEGPTSSPPTPRILTTIIQHLATLLTPSWVFNNSNTTKVIDLTSFVSYSANVVQAKP
ncbi:hypothetical protein F5Y10DRAFT_266094 [Nemania abortiva]|nr:hypothetical protein F5Y10DRAFT_266094 [Nemania abortiva]